MHVKSKLHLKGYLRVVIYIHISLHNVMLAIFDTKMTKMARVLKIVRFFTGTCSIGQHP